MTQGRWALIAGIMLSVFAVAFQAIGIATALPTVMEDLGATVLYPWAFTTFVSGMLLAVVVAGRVTDRLGPSLPIYVGFALFGIGLVMGWLAPSVWVLLAGRVVQGLGAGALNLTLMVIVAHGFRPEDRPRAMALVSFCWLLPAFVGPPIAAWLALTNWRLVFAVMVPLMVIAFAITLPGLRRVQAEFHGDGDVPPVPVAATIAVTLAPSFILLAGQPLGLWRWVSAAAGVAALAWGLKRIIAPKALGFGPGIPSIVLARATQAGAFFAAETIVLVTLQHLRGYTPFQVGLALTVGSLGWTLASWLQAQRWVPLSRDAFITLGAALSAFGIATLVAFAWFPGMPLAAALAGWIVAGLGMGLTMPSSSVAVMGLSSQFEQGRHQSSLQLAESVGNSVVTAVAGGIYTALLFVEPKKLSYSVSLGAVLLLAVAAIALSRRIGWIENELRVQRVST
ncbi:MFS transporter [Tessaracoccus sp. ZS01]|uniref:MFS transporter n=1 Tax=Tessaracoccus sp. ZS01 TaxID=1906324 RepID=UPI00096FDDB5|nr:MFS transporter [Tessaracoccus sp. ZS01]OMG57469.1 hypothetical protein BJN44_05405 [Tessaracoccus sp. ZS01]